MYVKLSKKFITKKLLPYLSQSNLGRKLKVPLSRIVKAIIFRLKTGCQWRELPIGAFCSNILISWNTVYYHFRKWSKDGSLKKMWTELLKLNRPRLDMSSIQFDGSHTPTKRGGEAVGYQNRKKSKTTNALFLTDKQGIPLAMSDPIKGNHHDLYNIEIFFTKILEDLKASDIKINDLFLNADAGFDSEGFRKSCFSNDIIVNIDFNKRNSKDTDNQPLKKMMNFTKNVFLLSKTPQGRPIPLGLDILLESVILEVKWISILYLTHSITLDLEQT